jgi:hypothetical protein
VSHERFDKLRERLLRAGIAPRHVRRYVGELRDHFDDLVREGAETGLTRNEAEEAARQRIGTEDGLAAVMLTRPELRSVTARFPWVAFGVGPVLMLAVFVATALLVQGGIMFWSPALPPWSIAWAKFSLDALNWLATYAAPLLIAASISIIGIRQRITPSWIVLGLAIICIVGGFHEIGVKWSSVPGQPSELYVGFGLAPPFPEQMIVSGLLRAVINLAFVSGAYWLWLRRAAHRMSYPS